MTSVSASEVPSILVIEDDQEIAYILKFILKREGIQIHYAEDGRQATEMIESMAVPKLVLCDINLPYVDGFHLIELMRSKETWREVPIVMLTSKAHESDVVRALNTGANDYVTKPFSPKELMARLRRFLK